MEKDCKHNDVDLALLGKDISYIKEELEELKGMIKTMASIKDHIDLDARVSRLEEMMLRLNTKIAFYAGGTAAIVSLVMLALEVITGLVG